MAALMDDRIKEYLLFRGLNGTVRAIESELRQDKDKGFRVDKILEQIHSYITNCDIAGLNDYWAYLERHLFAHLDASYGRSIRKLQASLLRIYLVNAMQAGRQEKINEFFEKLTAQLQPQAEWKDWFMLPYIKSPEENSLFAMYFSKSWQDTVFLSLNNFLSVAISTRPVYNFEQDQKMIRRLEEKNAQYLQQIVQLEREMAKTNRENLRHADKGGSEEERDVGDVDSLGANQILRDDMELCEWDGMDDDLPPVDPFSMPNAMELMDDFHASARSAAVVDKPRSGGTGAKKEHIKTFIRSITLPSSPIMGKKPSTPLTSTVTLSSTVNPATDSISRLNSIPGPSIPNQELVNADTTAVSSDAFSMARPVSSSSFLSPSCSASLAAVPLAVDPGPGTSKVVNESGAPRTAMPAVSAVIAAPRSHPVSNQLTESGSINPAVSINADKNSTYLLLSQEAYVEHTACIAQCRFSATGQTVATLDVDGVLKAWTLQPSPVTIASTMSKSVLTALEWANNTERLLLLGSKVGNIRLFDIKDKKTLKDVTTDTTCPRIISLASNPVGTSFVCSAAGRLRCNGPSADVASPRVGKLSVWDLKTMKVERYLAISPGPIAVNCMSYSNTGHTLLTGAADGLVRIYDIRSGGCISQWSAHVGEVYTTLFSADETSLYSLGSDGKLVQWSMARLESRMAELSIHAGAAGPFVTSGPVGQRLAQPPRGKLFAIDSDGHHLLTCTPTGGLIYQIDKDLGLLPSLDLNGHRSPVICVDWSSSVHYKTCLTAAMDGQIIVSTLLIQ